MPIKWSAVAVSEAMDEVERRINLAESFLADAKAKAEVSRRIANLPQYLDQRLIRLISDIERIDYVKAAIEAVRKAVPDGAIEAEINSARHGSQQSFIRNRPEYDGVENFDSRPRFLSRRTNDNRNGYRIFESWSRG